MVICLASIEGSSVKLVTYFWLWLGQVLLKTVGMIGDGESDEELDDELDDELHEELDDEIDDGLEDLGDDDSPLPPVRGCLPSSCAFNDAASLSLAFWICTRRISQASLATRYNSRALAKCQTVW